MSCILNGIEWLVGLFRYSPPYWEDERVPATLARVGANPPTFSQWGSTVGGDYVYAWKYSPTVVEDLFFSVQFPHKMLVGSEWRPHVHWCPSDNAAGNVVWRLSYRWSNVGTVFPAVTGSQITAAAGGTADFHRVASFPVIAAATDISAMLVGRIGRVATDPADTYPSSAVLLEIDFHHQQDTPGSRTEFTK